MPLARARRGASHSAHLPFEEDPHDASLHHLPSAQFSRWEDLGALHGQPGDDSIDWSFLAAGCLDEVSLVVAPAAPLTLISTEDLGEGTLWLRYNVEAG